MSSTVKVRRMASDDLFEVVTILKESEDAAQWSEETLRESLPQLTAWVAEQSGHVAGFLVARSVADEFEILNMAVARAHRRCGIASRLMTEALVWSRSAGAHRAYLEVRASNQAAILLYFQSGFRECGRRASYYASPVDDAILLSLDVKKSAIEVL